RGNRGIGQNSAPDGEDQALSRPRAAASGNGAPYRTRGRRCLPLRRGPLRAPDSKGAEPPRALLTFCRALIVGFPPQVVMAGLAPAIHAAPLRRLMLLQIETPAQWFMLTRRC